MLWLCVGLAVSAVTSGAKVDVVGTDDATQSTSAPSTDVKDAGTADNVAAASAADVSSTVAVDDHPETSTSPDAKNSCFLQLLTETTQHGTMPPSSRSGAVFWKSSWRQHLCRCATCLVSVVVV